MDGKSHKGKLQTELLFQQKLLRFISTRWATLSPWLCSGLYTRSGTAALERHREMWGQLPSASWLSDSTTSLSQRMWPTGLSWCIWVEQKSTTQIFLWCEMLCSQSYNSCSFDFTFFFTSSMAVVFANVFYVCVSKWCDYVCFLSRVVGIQTVVLWKKYYNFKVIKKCLIWRMWSCRYNSEWSKVSFGSWNCFFFHHIDGRASGAVQC